MFVLYNLLSIVVLFALSPVLIPIMLLRGKYRSRIKARLGIGLRRQLNRQGLPSGPESRIWIHALSVGEVTSALSLVQGIKEQYPRSLVVFSTTSTGGLLIARRHLSSLANCIIFSPVDLYLTTRHFIQTIRPDLFILVETDFWPNWLHQLAVKNIPMFLVNGRISGKSITRYQRFAFFFRPMFKCFAKISMQTAADAKALTRLGIPSHTLLNLGNLKYDKESTSGHSELNEDPPLRKQYGLTEHGLVWICGSTHAGEEEIILTVFNRLQPAFPGLQLMIAPRDIARAGHLSALAEQADISWCRRSRPGGKDCNLIILDTLGELAGCYSLADVVFIGGSLVPEGGHNPIEPASCGTPVLFGPHMEDFAEIADELLDKGGALQVSGPDSMFEATSRLLADPALRRATAEAGRQWVAGHRGVVDKHLAVIRELLSPTVRE